MMEAKVNALTEERHRHMDTERRDTSRYDNRGRSYRVYNITQRSEAEVDTANTIIDLTLEIVHMNREEVLLRQIHNRKVHTRLL
ncbi:hypothetical protein DPMN_173859 [Dreissena polymorpha]|uniref:Uncharacterized protein n=1 Tax=Dreissena polymorpha TaxID=45954 RepID=A0A9D4IGI7_DREPO|nr:hypothetical protein DPMN_173859 [Dreissena polymorpha]